MGKRNADIDKAMEELRYEKECALKIPFEFEHALLKLISKHDIGDITKMPDFITCHFLMGCLRTMKQAFMEYISCVCAEKMRANGDDSCLTKLGYPPNRKKFPKVVKTRVVKLAKGS
ncbi:MAG: hypothetical protein LBC87_12095 [Fibromonadaceae bacterium]|jgi:hypothetical protein|nr:hypothetical protein [Fibromonadaceae bacterium]